MNRALVYTLEADGSTPRAEDPHGSTEARRGWLRRAANQIRRGEWRIGRDVIGQHEVVTDFMGVDMNPSFPDPVLWETVIFEYADGQRGRLLQVIRHASHERAMGAHREIVEALTRGFLTRGDGKVARLVVPKHLKEHKERSWKPT